MIITKPYTFSIGTVIVASEHNSDFDILYNCLNGNLTNVNIKASAGIADTKLATIAISNKVNLTALVATSQATGDIIYKGASGYARLPIGTTGQHLKSGVAPITIDYMEYSSDALAQAAYVTNGGTTGYIISQTNPEAGNWTAIGQVSGAKYNAAQTFVLTLPTLISGFSIDHYSNNGSPTGNITGRIETVSAGTPTGTLADANLTKAYAPTASAWNDVAFTIPTILQPGTYALVLNGDTQSNGNYWWVFMSGGNLYTDGASYYSVNGGAYSPEGAGQDLTFKISGTSYSLLAYSEATIKTQGSYALKVVAEITTSLNKTLTKTF